MELSKEHIEELETFTKVIKNKISDVITKYIRDDTYSEDRPKKRRYLTDLECAMIFGIEDILKFIIDNNKKTLATGGEK